MEALPKKHYQRSTTKEALPKKHYQRSTTKILQRILKQGVQMKLIHIPFLKRNAHPFLGLNENTKANTRPHAKPRMDLIINLKSKLRENRIVQRASERILKSSIQVFRTFSEERGDVPGWVLVVLMTTGLVTGIWTLAAPRIDSILRNSLDSMSGIR